MKARRNALRRIPPVLPTRWETNLVVPRLTSCGAGFRTSGEWSSSPQSSWPAPCARRSSSPLPSWRGGFLRDGLLRDGLLRDGLLGRSLLGRSLLRNGLRRDGLLRWTLAREHRILERLQRGDAHSTRRLDADRFAGLRVAAHAG